MYTKVKLIFSAVVQHRSLWETSNHHSAFINDRENTIQTDAWKHFQIILVQFL